MSSKQLAPIIGIVLLAILGRTWIVSFEEGRFVGFNTSFPRIDSLGYDLYRNFHANEQAANGLDPYDHVNDVAGVEKYNHPPIVLLVFFWTRWFTFRTGTIVWTIALAAMAGFCVWRSWVARVHLFLPQPSFLLVLAAFLWSTPVLFAMDRGNWDFLAATLVLFAIAVARRSSLIADVLAGACFALAAWIKIYPGILLLGLVILRRWRLAGCTLVVAALIGLADFEGIRDFTRNMQDTIPLHSPTLEDLAYQHSLSASWGIFWSSSSLVSLARIPGTIAAYFIVAPLIIWVSYWARRCADAPSIVCPLFLWLMAAACFLLPIAYDYKLIYLLLLLLVTWNRNDPLILRGMAALLLIYAQPFNIGLGTRLIFLLKLSGFFGATVLLVYRIKERTVPLASGSVTVVEYSEASS